MAIDSFAAAVEALAARLPGAVAGLCADLHRDDVVVTLEPTLESARLLLLDPPRDGLRQTSRLLASAPALEKIFYVSCDVATFARDVRAAQEHGFSLQEVQPLDLFPQTPHLELLAVLTRR